MVVLVATPAVHELEIWSHMRWYQEMVWTFKIWNLAEIPWIMKGSAFDRN